MKTYNQFLETPFSEETAPPAEEKKPDAALTGKQKRATQIKKQVLMKKLQAVRAGSEDIVASHTPEGELVEGKGNKENKGRHPRDQKELDRAREYIKKNPKFGLKEGDVHSGQGEKIQKRTKKWMDKKGQKGAPGLDAMKARTAEHKAKRGVKEEKDAYKYVVSKLKAKYGDGVLTKGDKMPEPSAAQKKKNAAIRAKRAKEDHRDPTEIASSGRYSDRHSNRGSD